MKFRLGRGRRPDPAREGTVYRATPGFRLRGDVAAPVATATPPAAPAAPVPPSSPGSPGSPPAGSDPLGSAPNAPFALPDKGRSGGRGGRRARRWVIRLLVLALVLYPVLLGALAWTSMQRIDAFPTSGRPTATGGRTFLVIGSDSRSDLSRDERARLGTGQATGIRTDTIMLLHLNGSDPAVLVSIPRDSYVPIPGHGKDKINAAYAYGGPKLLVTTIEQATGLRIDDVVMTGLGGFAGLVDAIDGVRICPKAPLKDAKAHIDVPKGCQQMDGKTALGYARARYSDPRGDLGRVERQREVLAAIASRTLSPAVLAVPWRAAPAAMAGGKALTVDSGTTPWGLAQFVLGMRSVSSGGGVTLTVPIANAALHTSSGEAVSWDHAQAKRLFQAMASNDLTTVRAIAKAQQTN